MILKVLKNKVFVIILSATLFTIAFSLIVLYTLSQPNVQTPTIQPQMAYLLVLHDKFNQSLDKLNHLTYNDVRYKFNYKYIMIKGDGSVYQINDKDNKVIKPLYKVKPPTPDGTFFGWEININGTKYYVDSRTGIIVSTSP